jgi:hypothetical protein
MTKHYELIYKCSSKHSPAEKVRGFVLHLCLHMYVKMADPSKLSASGVCGGYVDIDLISFIFSTGTE